MSKKQNQRLRDASVFVRHALEIIRNHCDDPAYMPSKSDLHRFHRIREELGEAAHSAVEIQQRMEGRFEGRHQTSPTRE